MFFSHCATRFCPYDDSILLLFYGFVNPIGNPRNKDRKPVLNKGMITHILQEKFYFVLLSLLTFERTNSPSAYYNHLKPDSSDSNFKSQVLPKYGVIN